MIEEITGYLVLTALFLLLFFLSVFLIERYRERIQSVLKKKYKPLTSVPWDTIIKGLAVTGFILFSRKLIYYAPFAGVFQTKFSVWWINGKAHTCVFISIFLLFIIGLGMKMFKREIEDVGCGVVLIGTSLFAVIVFFFMKTVFVNDLIIEFPITNRYLSLVIFAPLLELKILCSGKYLGFLTSVLLGYFIVFVNKKYAPGAIRIHAHIMIASGLMFIIFVGFGLYKSLGYLGNWEQRLNYKVMSVTGESDMMDLLDVVHTIDPEIARHETLKQIVGLITKEGDSRWKKEIYQRVIEEVKTLTGYQSTRLLRKIILWIAGTGDITWAEEVAMSIQAKNIRNNVLKELREKIGEK